VGDELGGIDRGRAVGDAEVAEVRDLVDHRGDVEQRLRRNAADVEANAAERGIALDEDDLEAEVGGAKRRRVAARAGAENEQVADDVAAGRGRCSRSRRGSRCRCRRRRRLRGRSRRRRCRSGCRRRCSGLARGSTGVGTFESQDQRPFAHLVADRDAHVLDDAGGARRNLHRRLVAFDGDQALLERDRVARLDEHLDDRDVGEVADVRNPDIDRHSSTRRKSPSTCTR
jgi:hypothetical protein